MYKKSWSVSSPPCTALQHDKKLVADNVVAHPGSRQSLSHACAAVIVAHFTLHVVFPAGHLPGYAYINVTKLTNSIPNSNHRVTTLAMFTFK